MEQLGKNSFLPGFTGNGQEKRMPSPFYEHTKCPQYSSTIFFNASKRAFSLRLPGFFFLTDIK